MIASGRRRHLVTLQTVATAADNDASFTETPSTFAVARMAIEPATARTLERAGMGTLIAQASLVLTSPYISGVTTHMRALFGSRVLYILGVANPNEANRELILVCSEVVA
jgi:head-tail adaptor